MRIHTIPVALLLLASLTACSSGASTTDDPATTASRAPGQGRPSAAPEAGPASDSRLTIGQPYTWSGSSLDEKTSATGTTAVLGYSHDVKVSGWSSEALGIEKPLWGTVDVKVCNTKGGTVAVSQNPWSLAFPDDSRVTPMFLEGPGLPKPEYPTTETKVKAGDCLRGRIPFVMRQGQRPDRVFYETASTPDPVEWAIHRG